ncbi:helix-turn-helix transcriptional regulator [Pseudomonas sp. TH31]|uniref:helix-turn-helix transcriptional regulator n=1 Tax=Pseudomonas sp. TH31 TaxID=2796396 RepID=UPI0019128326|nr:AlpA family transcriptional regulator [Pseudomonas sp. TH31]MBK5415597.1 AlpA family transcriptional regulator [Pseudomonas sp. TH31]
MSTELNEQGIEFIRLPKVMELVGLSQTTIYDMANAGRFPKQVKLGGRAVAWVKSEVLAWSKQKVDDSRALTSLVGSSKTTMGNDTQ